MFGKCIVVLLAALFICGIIAVKLPGVQGVALGNPWGVSWMAILFVGCMVGGFKLIAGK